MDKISFRRKFYKFWDVVYPMVFFTLVLVICSIIALIIGAVFLRMPSEALLSEYPIVALYINIAFYAVTIFTQRKTYKRDDFRFGERKNKWKPWQIAVAALVAAVISTALNSLILISPLPEIFPGYYVAAGMSFMGQSPIILILATVILGPIAEELIFRGLTYDRLRHYVSIPAAIIISALMFGAYHANVIQFIYASIMGILLAFYYEKSGSILAPVVAHMVMNAVAIPTFF